MAKRGFFGGVRCKQLRDPDGNGVVAVFGPFGPGLVLESIVVSSDAAFEVGLSLSGTPGSSAADVASFNLAGGDIVRGVSVAGAAPVPAVQVVPVVAATSVVIPVGRTVGDINSLWLTIWGQEQTGIGGNAVVGVNLR